MGSSIKAANISVKANGNNYKPSTSVINISITIYIDDRNCGIDGLDIMNGHWKKLNFITFNTELPNRVYCMTLVSTEWQLSMDSVMDKSYAIGRRDRNWQLFRNILSPKFVK